MGFRNFQSGTGKKMFVSAGNKICVAHITRDFHIAVVIEKTAPGIRGRKKVLVVSGIPHQRGDDLFQIVDAGNLIGRVFRPIQRRQQHRRQNGDDRYNDQKFY